MPNYVVISRTIFIIIKQKFRHVISQPRPLVILGPDTDCCINSKDIFKVEIIEKIFAISNITRDVKWFDQSMHREEVIGSD